MKPGYEHDATRLRSSHGPLRLLICGSTGSGREQPAGALCSAVAGVLPAAVVSEIAATDRHLRNIAIAAADADLAVIVAGADTGLCTRTRQHTRILALMGVRHVVLAVDCREPGSFSAQAFTSIVTAFHDFAAGFGFPAVQAVPLSVLQGDNLAQHSARMPWYGGPALTAWLASVDVAALREPAPLRIALQAVEQQGSLTRFSGPVISGSVQPGAAVRVLPGGIQTRVKAVFSGTAEVAAGHRGEVVAVVLADSRTNAAPGDMLVASEAPPEAADQFEAKLLWMATGQMTPGRQYLLRLATKEVTATVTEIKYREDVDTGAQLASKTLESDDIATVNLSTSAAVVFEPCRVNRTLGTFMLLDKLSLDTVGIGTIDFALRRASNIHWQALELNKATRAAQKHQTPKCVWFTGLSGSGKSTIANLLDKRLHAEGRHTYLLDGDNVRHGLNRDLGFTEADRVENIRRVAEVAKLMVDAGLIVLVSFISPFRSERRMARELFADGEFVEVFVDTPIAECERRDVKGLYAKARRGELKNFTGIDSPYEAPLAPEIRLDTTAYSGEACVDRILEQLGAAARGADH